MSEPMRKDLKAIMAFVRQAKDLGAVKVAVGDVVLEFGPLPIEVVDPNAGLNEDEIERRRRRQRDALIYGSA